MVEDIAKGPGPTTIRAALVLWLKGFAMGCADIIPGVSGGTVALITGVYEQLIEAIKSFDGDALSDCLRLRLGRVVQRVHIKFLALLFLGILAALFSLARVVHYLLEHHGVLTAALFFGLIGASIWFVAGTIERWRAKEAAAFALGAIAAFLIVGLIPLQTPETWWFVFLCGVIAICAMILPGISGAFLLLILGKYAYLTAALKNPFSSESAVIILFFGLGAVLGLTSFSRVLSYFLNNHHGITMAALTGLMAGSLRKIWPWKETLETTIIRGKTHILRERNVVPDTFDQTFWVSVILCVLGVAVVIILERMAKDKDVK